MNVKPTVENLENRDAPTVLSIRDFIGSVIAARMKQQLTFLYQRYHHVGPLRQQIIAREIRILSHRLFG